MSITNKLAGDHCCFKRGIRGYLDRERERESWNYSLFCIVPKLDNLLHQDTHWMRAKVYANMKKNKYVLKKLQVLLHIYREISSSDSYFLTLAHLFIPLLSFTLMSDVVSQGNSQTDNHGAKRLKYRSVKSNSTAFWKLSKIQLLHMTKSAVPHGG